MQARSPNIGDFKVLLSASNLGESPATHGLGRFLAKFDWSEGSFFRETGYSLISVALYAAQQWFVVKLLLVYCGLQATGWYGYVMGFLVPLFTLANANLRAVLIADHGQTGRSDGCYVRTRVGSTALAALVAIPLGAILLTKPESGAGFAVYLLLFRTVESLSDIFQGFFQKAGSMRKVVAIQFMRLLSGMPLFWVGLGYFNSPELAFALLVFSSVLVVYFVEWVWIKRTFLMAPATLTPSATECFRLWWHAAPLGVGLFVSALQQNVPRFALRELGTLEELGVFFSLGYLVVLASFGASAVGLAAAPRFGRFAADGNRGGAKRLLGTLLAIDFLLVGLLGLLFWGGHELLIKLLLDKKVIPYASLLPLVLLMGLAIFCDSHIGVAVTALRSYKAQMVLQIAKAAATVPASYFFISKWGLGGAFLAVAITNGLSAAGLLLLWRHRIGAMAPIVPA